MTTWHWVRHAPTHEKSFVGWRDVPADLTDSAQIARLQDHLPKEAVLLSSDLSRACLTADALSQPDRIRLPHLPQLREMHFGIWDGMHHEAVSARDPHLSRAFWEKPGDVAAPGGESWDMTATRVNAAVDHLNEKYRDAHIIAVAHFGVILTQVQRALGCTPYESLGHRIDNYSVTEIAWNGGFAEAIRINHLP